MELFYDPSFKGDGILCESESKHCINVLRHKAGDIITIANGKGQYFEGTIINAHPKKCKIGSVKTINHTEPEFKVHLAVAPTKSMDRFEWLIEKAVELGVDEITPLLCSHSERKKLRIDRIERIAISAMKQSLKAYMPKVNELTTFTKFIESTPAPQTYLAHCYDDEKQLLKDAYQLNSDAVLCIGPEGDFSPEEVKMAKNRGCHMVSLGTSRLRTETAGLAACHTIHLLNE
ncbi:16S rRNA (uracil(1498)-N(3))-methyltransferase [Carboxylicivirga caseinilyticus]|uniref:16S rRNA (uracil(1498)-N(3))-methyltransferase n=1 Tax=Carboxylicivirga caseinilyticus TaxID=3417572 RepID=UPI003D3567FD|nr:16S rRNA (uracil(1498)-N(3))-methyltransferase [Marinilabiliaceae bacterium A049]